MKEDELVVLAPGAWPLLYEYYVGLSGKPAPNMHLILPPSLGEEHFQRQIADLPAVTARYRRVWVVYDLYWTFDPSGATFRYFERNWRPREYGRLWGDLIEIATYDNPNWRGHQSATSDEGTSNAASRARASPALD